MAKFKISAPGRIVLTGEHIALHGKTFLATSLNLRTTLEFYELPNTPKNIKIEFPNVNLYQDISLNLVKPFFSLSNVKDIISNPLNLREYVRYLITVEKCMWTAQHELYSLEIFFFLLYYIAHREHLKIKPFYIKVSTELPVAAGLGSSTSFAVCLAACFVHWKHVQSGNYNFKFDDADLESIKTYTEFCEKSTQVYAFGVDAHVCTYGKVVKCRRTDHKTYNIDSQDMEEMEKMPIILIDSKFYHSKTLRAEQIMKNAVATDFDNILNTLELQAINMFRHLKKISDMMEKSILKGESISFDYVMPHLIFLTQNNQQLLDRYKLSAEAFENVCKIARMSNLAGKLTGFGVSIQHLRTSIAVE
ncbi:mevalonate kinase-like isoform X2 [Nylanderia fulva]|uniref:mevalonate kinase-like isoform X2 n=1 Tax=Nylanderia fulva TaxID=613905 RepID=UPI0010FBA1A4|nr:mevalonate kinase-like isoform X2 [Nylanderia fulva]